MAFRTESHLTASLALYLLQSLLAHGLDSRTLEDLLEDALRNMPEEQASFFRSPLRDVQTLTNSLLEDFTQIGIVRIERGEPPRYRAVPMSSEEGPPADLPPIPDGAGTGDGGSGMAEVLAHPILFSVSPEDFEAALERALESY